jgi:uncharacterized membrane protein
MSTSKVYQIRYNTVSKDDTERWRLIDENGIETLVSDIFVNGEVYTTKDHMGSLGYKWHITCKGNCVIKDNIAHITTPPKESAFKRHLLKTISYRFLGTLTTVVVAYTLGAPIAMASMLGVGELAIKPILYFIHERVWYKFVKLK